MADLMDTFKDDFALLIEAGFVAVSHLDEPSAQKLFRAAEALDPEHPAPRVGLGFIALNKLEVKEAEKTFKEVLKEHPDHHLAQTFLGMAYLLVEPKRAEGEKLIKDAMSKTDDPSIVNLGKTSLDWADKDLKKTKAPFFKSE